MILTSVSYDSSLIYIHLLCAVSLLPVMTIVCRALVWCVCVCVCVCMGMYMYRLLVNTLILSVYIN